MILDRLGVYLDLLIKASIGTVHECIIRNYNHVDLCNTSHSRSLRRVNCGTTSLLLPMLMEYTS